MKRQGTTILAAIALLGLLLPQIAMARSWTVEKDGSGDFAVIQDAIDAADPGDTIRIGPGRFGTFHVRTGQVNGNPVVGVLVVQKPGLTVVGAGCEQTFIGPAGFVDEYAGRGTGSLLVDEGTTCVIRDLSFDNTRWEVTLYGQTIIEDCAIRRGAFRTDRSLVVGFNAGTVIRRLVMTGTGGIGTVAGVADLLIEDCEIEDDSDWTVAVQLSSGPTDCVVRNCTIRGGAGGIQYSGTGVVEDCILEAQTDVALNVVGGGHMVARRCFLGVTRRPVSVSIGRIEIYDSVLEGGTGETISSTAEVYVRGSHILNAGGTTIRGRTSVAGEYIDVRHNWWGTSDTAQIEAWIDDRYGTVLWEPHNDQPISTEDSSISELKGKFGKR